MKKRYSGLEVAVKLIKRSRKQENIIITRSSTVFELVKDEVNEFDREKMLTILLDRKNKVLGIEETFTGSLSGCGVYPREIVKLAILGQAAAVVCVHNHPSGDPRPSRQDKKITEAIARALKTVDVCFHDHIILGQGTNKYHSMADRYEMPTI